MWGSIPTKPISGLQLVYVYIKPNLNDQNIFQFYLHIPQALPTPSKYEWMNIIKPLHIYSLTISLAWIKNWFFFIDKVHRFGLPRLQQLNTSFLLIRNMTATPHPPLERIPVYIGIILLTSTQIHFEPFLETYLM